MRQSYKIVEKIDMGGMAEVYRARAVSMKGFEKEVAIKRVLPSLTRNRRFVSMFLDEARLSMGLSHPNIVQVFDVGRAEGTYYIVMEFVEGLNLRRAFQKNAERAKGMPLSIAAFILTEVLKGLTYAHEKADDDGRLLHVVHRDVSPPNVLISRAGDVKLTDFGLAKAASQLTETDPGVVKGKFSYLSPEACQGKSIDHRADIFSAGIILWELLANRRLFVGKNDMETVDLIRSPQIPSLSLLNSEIDPEFEAIAGKALREDPSRRYNSAREFGQAINNYLFSHGLKVDAYDLANYVQSLFDGTDATDDADQIAALLQEEILNLSVVGLINEAQMGGHGASLNADRLGLTGGSIDVDDLFNPEDLVRATKSVPEPLSDDDETDLATMLEGSTREIELDRLAEEAGLPLIPEAEEAEEIGFKLPSKAKPTVEEEPQPAPSGEKGSKVPVSPLWLMLFSALGGALAMSIVYIVIFKLKACG